MPCNAECRGYRQCVVAAERDDQLRLLRECRNLSGCGGFARFGVGIADVTDIDNAQRFVNDAFGLVTADTR